MELRSHERSCGQRRSGGSKASPPPRLSRGFLYCRNIKGRQTGVFQRGRFPDLDSSFLSCPSLSFLGLSRFFRDFPDLLGDGPGFSRFVPFLFLGLLKSTFEEQSRRVRDTIWTFPEKNGKHLGLETPRFSFSQEHSRRRPYVSQSRHVKSQRYPQYCWEFHDGL